MLFSLHLLVVLMTVHPLVIPLCLKLKLYILPQLIRHHFLVPCGLHTSIRSLLINLLHFGSILHILIQLLLVPELDAIFDELGEHVLRG